MSTVQRPAPEVDRLPETDSNAPTGTSGTVALKTSDPKTWPWPEAADFVKWKGQFDPPSLFAKALVKTIPIEPNKTRLLDLGCGTGVIGGLSLLWKKAQFVTFNDIQEAAILVTRFNAAVQIENGKIKSDQVDYITGPFVGIAKDVVDRHDLIAFNPPQLPTDCVNQTYLRKMLADPSMTDYRNGGPGGLKIVEEFLGWYAGLPWPKPTAVILLSSFLGKNRIANAIAAHGLRANTIGERPAVLRPILTEAADRLSSDERKERSLEKVNGTWIKTLRTISLTDC
jgi:methylase of polypeptide subunit release factors